MVAQAEMTDTSNKRVAARLAKVGSCLVHWTIASLAAAAVAMAVIAAMALTGTDCK